MDFRKFFKSKKRDTEIYRVATDSKNIMSKLIDKVRYDGNFDISVDAKKNLLVNVCIDKQDFHLMLFPTLEQAENFGIGRGNIIEPINIKLTQSFDVWKKEQVGYVVIGNDGQNEVAQNVH